MEQNEIADCHETNDSILQQRDRRPNGVIGKWSQSSWSIREQSCMNENISGKFEACDLITYVMLTPAVSLVAKLARAEFHAPDL